MFTTHKVPSVCDDLMAVPLCGPIRRTVGWLCIQFGNRIVLYEVTLRLHRVFIVWRYECSHSCHRYY